jgi:steroid delta-isomerase-like uncharacterized protein
MRLLPLLIVAGLCAAFPSVATAGPEENKAIAERLLLERMGQGRFEISDEIYGPGFVAHGFGRDFTLAQDEESGRALRRAFPDLSVRVDRVVGEGELVAVHWSATGTNSIAGGGFPGNGRPVSLDGMSFFRFADGRIVEEWSVYDRQALADQLSAQP